ncbi:MAG: OsmC family peroxiredoxin [Chlorobiaceae bacterium]|nr:OsmC family peroxiredoxin [Chlorobiaceae bacterium]
MQAKVTFKGKLPLVGVNDKGHKTRFDATMDFSGPAKYASPMDTVLEALGGCSMMDIIVILKKKRKELILLEADLDAERSEEHPKVFTAIHVKYRLKSPDCTLAEFEKTVTLSMEKYCSVAAMLRGSGCRITWSTELV